MQSRKPSMSSFAFAFNNNRYCTHRLRLNIASAEASSSSSFMITREIISVTSVILAQKSGYFRELFDGSRYNNRNVGDSPIEIPVPLTPEELNPFKQLLFFIYSGQMTSTNPETLLRVLKLAVRYQVQSCCARICEILLPQVDLKLAITFLNILPELLNEEDVQMLKETAITCVVNHFKHLPNHTHTDQLLQLSFPGMQQVLSRNDVEVSSEDELFEFLQMWMQRHNSTQNELELFKALIPLLKLGALRCSTLQNILDNFKYDVGLVKPVVEALISKILHGTQGKVGQGTQGEVGRRYTRHPVSIFKFQQPTEGIEVYMDIEAWAPQVGKRVEGVSSEAFEFCGSRFTLSAVSVVNTRGQNSVISLLLFVQQRAGEEEISVDYLLAIRQPNTKEFEDFSRGVHIFKPPVLGRFRNSLGSTSMLPDNMIGHTLYIKLALTRQERFNIS